MTEFDLTRTLPKIVRVVKIAKGNTKFYYNKKCTLEIFGGIWRSLAVSLPLRAKRPNLFNKVARVVTSALAPSATVNIA